MLNCLKIVAISDIHFGHAKLNAEATYKKLSACFYPEVEDAHLVIIAGDLYDQLLTVNSRAHKFASLFVRDLLTYSAKTGMQVRLLHGTFTHDRDQLSIFSTIADPIARFKVVNGIYVEELKDFRTTNEQIDATLRIGYIPDNLPYKYATDAVEQLKTVMSVAGYPSLDVLVVHGAFSHVIPESTHAPSCLYNVEQFTMVNGPLILGHIHTPGKYRNAYYCGSFERMAHGEEEPKGFYVFSVNLDEKEYSKRWKATFKKNTYAIPFISITPDPGDDISAITQEFISKVDELFPERKGFVRVLHPSSEIRSILHRICVQTYPDIIYSSKAVGDTEKTEMKIEEIQLDVLDDVKPNVNNLGDLVYAFLDEHQLLGDITKEELVNAVKGLIAS